MNIKDYIKILKNIDTKKGSFIKLQIIFYLIDSDEFKQLNEENQEKLVDFIYSYYMQNDIEEYDLEQMTYGIINSSDYGYINIIENINNIDYQKFENILNDKLIIM